MYNKEVKEKYPLGEMTAEELTRKGLVKGLWKLMRTVWMEMKRIGRQYLKLFFILTLVPSVV